jgi:hypothetical protein
MQGQDYIIFNNFFKNAGEESGGAGGMGYLGCSKGADTLIKISIFSCTLICILLV